MATSSEQTTTWPPDDRPIMGRDLEEFRIRHGLDLNGMEMVFGIASRGAWYRLTRKQADEPIKDKTVAILLRFYSAHPEQIPIREIDIKQVWEKLGLSATDYAQLIGRKGISGRDWERQGTRPLPVVREISKLLDRAGSMDHPIARAIQRFSNLEGKARGQAPLELGRQGPARKRRTKRQTEGDRSMIAPIDD